MGTIALPFAPEEAQFLTANFPQLVKNLGTNFPVSGLAYDAATAENAFFKLNSINYGSGNLTLTIYWYADTATTGDVVWGAQIAAITPNSDITDIEAKAFATAQTATQTTSGSSQALNATTITISNLDALANNDEVWLKIYRDAAVGGDTMAGDAILIQAKLTYSDV